MSELRDENDAEHYYNATVRLMAEVAELRDENKRLRGAIAEIRAGKGRRPNPGYPDYVEAYDDWIVEVFDRWGV